MRSVRLSTVVAVELLVGAVVFTLSACNGVTSSETRSGFARTTPNTAAKEAVTENERLPEPPPRSPWQVSTSRSELSGELTIAAVNGLRNHAIVIRQRGTKLDCYVTTGEFLETVDNMHSRRATVGYKFDEGNIVRQPWVLSDDNTALFYPGNARPFLQKLRTAKRFVIEFSSADKVPETEVFDVSPFPPELAEKLNIGGSL